MAFKPVGVDDNSHFPQRVRDALNAEYVKRSDIGPPAYVAPQHLKRYESLPCLYNAKPSNIRRWRLGLAKAARADYNATPATLNELWIGDSILGGCTGLGQATGTDTTRFDRLNAVAKFHERDLSQRSGVPVAGTGLVRLRDGSHQDDRVTYTGTVDLASICLGLHTGAAVVFVTNFPGNAVVVQYYDNFTTAGLSVSVNGAVSGANFLSITGTGTNKWKTTTLSGATIVAGDSVKLTATAAQTIQVGLIEVYNSAIGGIRSHNLALSGTKAGDTTWYSTSTGFTAFRQVSDSSALPFVPDVVHVGWGLFDASITPVTTMQRYHDTYVLLRNTFPNSDFVLHALPVPVSLTDSTWLPYNEELYVVADELDCPLIDLQDLFGGGQTLSSLGVTADTTAHYLQPVYKMWGEAITHAII